MTDRTLRTSFPIIPFMFPVIRCVVVLKSIISDPHLTLAHVQGILLTAFVQYIPYAAVRRVRRGEVKRAGDSRIAGGKYHRGVPGEAVVQWSGNIYPA